MKKLFSRKPPDKTEKFHSGEKNQQWQRRP